MASKGSQNLLGSLARPPTASGISLSVPDERSARQLIRGNKPYLKWRVAG
jgi:hypothetical protein